MSNAITTRGNVFRILYVGQSIKDVNKNALVDSTQEVQSEYLGGKRLLSVNQCSHQKGPILMP